jgi:hypothetical protein
LSYDGFKKYAEKVKMGTNIQGTFAEAVLKSKDNPTTGMAFFRFD